MARHVNKGWVYVDRIGADATGMCVLDFYAERYGHSTRDQWRERIAGGQIRLEGTAVDPDTRLAPGLNLTYHRPPWQEPDAPGDLAILHEDAHVLAVAKPSGLPVLPGGEYLDHTLLALVRARYADAPAPVHRLGRATSGVVIFARSTEARRQLSEDLRKGRMGKRYRALVRGEPDSPLVIRERIGRVPYPGLGYVHAAAPTGKEAETRLRLLERRVRDEGGAGSLVEVEIPTGRPHQIRIHLAAVGHPLVGDPLYVAGGQPRLPEPGERPALPGDCGYHLHAMSVAFTHPGTLRYTIIYCQPPEILRAAHELTSPEWEEEGI